LNREWLVLYFAKACMRLLPEFEYFKKHQDELVEKYGGKVIVIKGQTVIGAYDSYGEAVYETEKAHELGTFLVQRCDPGIEAYTQVFHSRVGVG
jgi:hypothetical protein